MDQELSRFKMCLLAIEELSRGFLSNEARWIEVVIEHPEDFLIDRGSYRELSRMR